MITKFKTYINESSDVQKKPKVEIEKSDKELIEELKLKLQSGDISIIKLRPYLKKINHFTLLYWACIYGHLLLAEYCVGNHSIRNIKKNLSHTIIFDSVNYNPEILKLIFKHGFIDINHETFRELCDLGKTEEVEIFLSFGNRTNKFSDDLSAFKYACDNQYHDIIKLFIKFGFEHYTKGMMKTIPESSFNTIVEEYNNIVYTLDIDELKRLSKVITVENGFPADADCVNVIDSLIDMNYYTKVFDKEKSEE